MENSQLAIAPETLDLQSGEKIHDIPVQLFQGCPAAKKCFYNHLIMQTIFRHLGRNDLLTTRVVCHQWNENATLALRKREDAIIKLEQSRKTDQFMQKYSTVKTLDDLTLVMKTSENFPIVRFEFDRGNLQNDDSQGFLDSHGKLIRSLRIVYSATAHADERIKEMRAGKPINKRSPTALSVIGRILTVQAPNIENLDVGLPAWGDWPGSSASDLLPLPKLVHLKKIYSGSPNRCPLPLFTQLLKVAVNLTSIKIAHTEELQVVIDLGLTHKIEAVFLSLLHEEKEIEVLENFAPLNVPLKGLEFSYLNIRGKPHLWSRTSVVLSKLLHCSHKSLEKLRGLSELTFLPPFDLPVFPKIKEYSADQTEYSYNVPKIICKSKDDPTFMLHCNAIIPRGFLFSSHLPNLYHFNFFCNLSDPIVPETAAARWAKWFPPTIDPANGVQSLRVSSTHSPILWFERLSKLFPNVTILVLNFREDNSFETVSRAVWTFFKKLKSLTIEIDIEYSKNSWSAIDSGFTGFSREDCKQLRNSSLNVESTSPLTKFPSVSDLQDLETLNIHVMCNEQHSWMMERFQAEDLVMLMLEVAGRFAFVEMQKLEQINVYLHNNDLFCRELIKEVRRPFNEFNALTRSSKAT